MLRSCIVNLKSDSTSAIQGVLWRTRGPWLTLRDAHYLVKGQPPTSMDGEVVIHRSNVAYLQVP